MSRFSLFCLLLLFVRAAHAQPSPRQLYPALFKAVQLGHVFPDGKTFVDARPRRNPADIERLYLQQRGQSGFSLPGFVAQHFELPAAATATYRSHPAAGLRHHLDTLWTVLTRQPQDSVGRYSSLLPLPRPYVVPGGRFREVYYWDSYFTMLGLRESGRTPLIRGMVDNFASLISRQGFIPNGNRSYYLTRSQPPFFSQMVELLAQVQGDSVRRRYQPQLLREYQYWMAGADSLRPGEARRCAVRLPGGEVLNRYWDAGDYAREESYAEDVATAKQSRQPAPQFYRNVRAAAASGWDFSTRWFGAGGTLASIRTTELLPVDLNCLLYGLEQTLARGYRQQGHAAQASAFEQRAEARKKALLRYCWDAGQGWFVDYDLTTRQPARVRTLAAAFPLYFGLATQEQAQRVAAGLQRDFLKPGGLVTTLTRSGQQWDAPNGWAPLQYVAIEGLERYQQSKLARTVATRWVALNVRVFNQTGKLLEKYNVEDTALTAGGGEYPTQDGFGWTNGVLLTLMNRYKIGPAK
ncbi:alpha,alpha-trehalase TreA [Hymenobacter jeollabukensis]|uniref:Alpha,alpha-trehalase TreA n=1 Tax=Hymenobacter jeollabukensis TaxID=2025313 RepID=A0A5R8WRX4_9BACT|nr:alpha,alpha-trehalase TreA [Hymenobacter jeollabukensis]TLM93925.1 alpha,alpha-trehalase TreA [Hymenobacter jeollabukensis]